MPLYTQKHQNSEFFVCLATDVLHKHREVEASQTFYQRGSWWRLFCATTFGLNIVSVLLQMLLSELSVVTEAV